MAWRSKADIRTGRTHEERVADDYDRSASVPADRRTARQQRHIEAVGRRLRFFASLPPSWRKGRHTKTPSDFE